MKTVINALAYKPNSSGIGVVIRELFGRYVCLAQRPCQVILSLDAPPFPVGKDTELVRIPTEHGKNLRRIFFQSFRMGRRYCRDAVLLTTDSKTPFFLPRSCTLVPLVTDLAVFRMPEVYLRSRALLWRLQYGYVRRRAAFFLTISEFTRQELIELLHIPAERIHVIPMACEEQLRRVGEPATLAALREKYALPERFILFVGNANPRKNLERTIRAFDLLKEKTSLPHRLVITGEQGWRFDREKALAGVKHRQDVLFTDFVPDEDKAALYSAADLFVFPSLYEGFGIPVLEAQACGVPVVTANSSSLPEVAGQGAVFVDPYDPDDICRGMRAVLEDPALARALAERGRRNAQRFSWQRSAERLNDVLEKETAAQRTAR